MKIFSLILQTVRKTEQPEGNSQKMKKQTNKQKINI